MYKGNADNVTYRKKKRDEKAVYSLSETYWKTEGSRSHHHKSRVPKEWGTKAEPPKKEIETNHQHSKYKGKGKNRGIDVIRIGGSQLHKITCTFGHAEWYRKKLGELREEGAGKGGGKGIGAVPRGGKVETNYSACSEPST